MLIYSVPSWFLHFVILSLLFSSAASSSDRNRSRTKAHLLPSPREKVCVRSFSYSISSVHCVLLPLFESGTQNAQDRLSP